MDKYIGRLLDNRYEILEVIGTGGMAVVYKARCHRLNRLVAIKILKDDYLEDEDFRRRFHAESQAVAMLSHPNIVSVYDVSTSIKADYIVMELIEGISLKQYMEKKGVLNWKETLHFAIQIAKALEHAHSRGIVHRDIKPHNVMVLKNGSVKVADFGIARVMSKGNTLTKEALGSVHYISPEQAKGGRVDSRSDIYSLGVVMYEMMSGRPPYDGDSPVAVAIQHINGGAVMPSMLNPNIPGGLEQIIMKAMAHEISDRYTSATQMLTDMDVFRKEPGTLFDYNLPPIDAVTNLPKPPITLQPQRPSVAERITGSMRMTGSMRIQRQRTSGGAVVRNGDDRLQAERRRRRQEREAEKRNRTATIAIVACSLVAVIAIVIFLLLRFTGGIGQPEDRITVPNFIGQVLENLPENPDFMIIHDSVYHDLIPAGQIIEQTPKAGDKVVPGTRVNLIVSRGPAPDIITVADMDLEGRSKQSAIDRLTNLNLNLDIQIVEEFNETVDAGDVIRVEPKNDVQLTAGLRVTLYISKGKEIKNGVMPNLVENRKETAIKALEAKKLELKIKVEEVFDSFVSEGFVVRTEPAKGGELTTGQEVKLYISKGPELVEVPNMVGANIQTASNLLKTFGFGVPNIEYVDSNEPKDTVVSQSHEKNTKVDINTKITLEVSKGPKIEPSVPTGPANPSEPSVPVQPGTEAVQFQLPEDHLEDYTLLIRCNGEIVGSYSVKGGQASIVVNLTGSGKQTYELWIGDTMFSSQEVDFAANG